MKVLGVELNANELRYVMIEGDSSTYEIGAANRMELADTRSQGVLSAFQSGLMAMLNETAPDVIAIKSKPESGRLRAGSAALKMEALVLASAKCNVEFISAARYGKVTPPANSLKAFLQPALISAIAAID